MDSSLNKWDAVLKPELSDAVLANVSAEDGAFACTDSELLYVNAAGLQRAALAQIAKVNREGSDIVISSADGVLIRGPVSANQDGLVAFFDVVKMATSKAKAVKASSPVAVNQVGVDQVGVDQVGVDQVAAKPVDAAPISSFAMDTPATSSHSTFTPTTSTFPDAQVASASVVKPVVAALPRTGVRHSSTPDFGFGPLRSSSIRWWFIWLKPCFRWRWDCRRLPLPISIRCSGI
jgi:hypothetical protein